MKGATRPTSPISATDLSPIVGLSREDETWLAEIAKKANTDTLCLGIGTSREIQQSPVVSYDSQTGTWWAGRFIGEISYQGRTLRILPRFGMPALMRWLSRVWGVRLLASTGTYAHGKIWLWELIARLWSNRFLLAAKHGLPRIRAEEVHIGTSVRGRLLVQETALNLQSGRQNLVSRTRSRRIDPRIGGIILGAHQHLQRELAGGDASGTWLSSRGQELVRELRAAIDRAAIDDAWRSRNPIRYTPINESFRAAVDLSLVILRGRPFMSSADGTAEVYGVLLDMAEIWELYLYHLIRDGLPEVEVLHTGRSPDAVFWLLNGRGTDHIGAMKPDILVSSRDGARRLVLDAKYKTTTPSPGRPYGVLREDLYQMAAYLSVASAPSSLLDGGLLYPQSTHVASLAQRSPFRIDRSDAKFFFFGIDCDQSHHVGAFTPGEMEFVSGLRKHVIAEN